MSNQHCEMYKRNIEYAPSPKAIRIIKEAISLGDINITKSFDLFVITSYIQEKMPKAIERETSHIDTCSEIMKVINWLVLNSDLSQKE